MDKPPKTQTLYTIPICLTHRCNLSCVYCFQAHDSEHEMDFETCKKCIDHVAKNILNTEGNHVEFTFFGGEPLLRFELIKSIVEYTLDSYPSRNYHFFANTNGTVLDESMKCWFADNRDLVCLGLSLDGGKESQNSNRSGSFDKIDFQFFKRNWPNQNVKMTVSELSLSRYAQDVQFIHSLGFGINGADLCVGTFNWSAHRYLRVFAKQLLQLIPFYVDNPQYYNALFHEDIAACAAKRIKKKNCQCGDKIIYFDTDGKTYPCTYLTPMSFTKEDINYFNTIDFKCVDSFVDEVCYQSCYLYPICRTCAAEDYLSSKSFCHYDKTKCSLREMIAVVLAEYNALNILKHPELYSDSKKYYTIEAIKEIKKRYFSIYQQYFKMEESENPEKSRK